ncbi:ABC transporter transmembrane region 2-domain-containing protein [Scheffersomyces amazonensis]|uniref:ABC transporter transmembrane region 2-domain-containing protein n=1 Tax=Scheffersomyces amazonensis TaxID=1078765 RepID=UPI00315D6968
MVSISTLTGAKRQDIKNVLLLLQEFVVTYKDNKVKINYQSRPVVLFLATLYATAGFGIYFTLRNLLTKYNEYLLNKKINRPALIRQSSTILKNGSREIFISKGNNKVSRIIIPKPNLDQYAADKYLYKNFYINQQIIQQSSKGIIFNSKFLNQLSIIWGILIPKFYCKNTSLLLSQCFFLILRTWLSLLVAKLDGQIVKNLIAANGKKFSRDLIYWLLIAFPASYTNAAIKYLDNRLSLGFRTNLTRYIHDMYLDKVMSYYKVSLNTGDPNGFLENIDQYITEDISKFCNSLSGLFSSMGKPFIDLIFFSVYLRDNLGTGAIIGIFTNYFITAVLLKRATPPFGKLSSQRTHLEGQYFNKQLNLMNNCEEIGFYKGSLIEKTKLNHTFKNLMNHVNKEINISFNYGVIEDYVLKYTWSAWGYIFAGLPVFLDEIWPKQEKDTINKEAQKVDERKNMRQFIINKRLMLSLADAGSRLMYSIKDVNQLTGHTDRVFNLLTQLHKVHSPRYDFGSKYGYGDIHGTIQNNFSDGIRFENFPVIIPNVNGGESTPLFKEISIHIKQGKNLLILGPNGCGKTSISRIVAGLWPFYRGLLSKPNDDDMFYLPQKTYFTTGNLRDQIIYPYTYNDMLEMGYNDDYLYHILREVKLEYLLKREGNFNVVKDWKDVFSGGEKQRMSIARVLFKHPKYVILDESTNAVSTDVEDYLFELLQTKGINFITMSHRPLLMKYHDFVLEIKDDRSWEFQDLTSEENLKSIDKEIKEIETKLAQVEVWEKRKQDIELFLDGKYNDINEESSIDMGVELYRREGRTSMSS